MTTPTTLGPAAASTPSTPAEPATSPPMVEPHPKAALSPTESAQLAQWAKEDFAKGRITQAQLEAQFADLNTAPEDRALDDPKTPEQKQLDTLHPPAKPSEYTIRYGDETVQSPELKQFDQLARMWLSGAQFNRMTGNSLVNTIDRVAQQTQKMTSEQLDYYGETEYAKLEKAYGLQLEEKLTAAGRMVEDLEKKQPGLKNLLKAKGIGDNALVASMLIAQSEVYWKRREKR